MSNLNGVIKSSVHNIGLILSTAILFDDAILLGAENDTTLYTSDSNSVFSLPFCVVNRTVSTVLEITF